MPIDGGLNINTVPYTVRLSDLTGLSFEPTILL